MPELHVPGTSRKDYDLDDKEKSLTWYHNIIVENTREEGNAVL